MTEKHCHRCEQTKPVSAFSPNKLGRDGFHSLCKECKNLRGRLKWAGAIPPRPLLTHAGGEYEARTCSVCKGDFPAHPDFFSPAKRGKFGLAGECKPCVNERAKRRQKQRSVRDRINANFRQRYARDPSLRLRFRISVAMRSSLRGRKDFEQWQDLVGYTAEDLRQHLERQFLSGMTWQAFLAGRIEVDHIIPVASFDFTKPDDDDFKACWALANLRPLWTTDNRKKRDRRFHLV